MVDVLHNNISEGEFDFERTVGEKAALWPKLAKFRFKNLSYIPDFSVYHPMFLEIQLILKMKSRQYNF